MNAEQMKFWPWASGHGADDAPPISPRLEHRLFWLMVAITILPVWTVTYFPSQDGPIHLYVVHLLENFFTERGAVLRDYFELNGAFEPNLGFYAFGLLLGRVFDLLIVEKIFLSGLALGLCLAVRYAVRTINPNALVYSLLVAPTAFHIFVHLGFYNYCLSIALFLFAFVFCLRWLDDLGPRNLALMGLVALALVFTHLMGFMALALGLGVAMLWHHVVLLRQGQPRAEVVRHFYRISLKLGLAALPALLVAAAFFLRHGISGRHDDDRAAVDLVATLFRLETLHAFNPIEVWLTLPWVILFYVLIVYTMVRHVREGSLAGSAAIALVPLVLVLIFFFSPISTRRIHLGDRFIPFIVYLLLIWFATLTPGPRLARAVAAVAVVTTLAMSGYRVWVYDRWDSAIAGYVEAGEVTTSDKTLLPLHFAHRQVDGMRTSFPLGHAAAHVAREQDLVYFRASLLSRNVFGYFPLIYREEVDPYIQMGRNLERAPPVLDFVDYAERTGGSIDYVLIWPYAFARQSTDEIGTHVLDQLDSNWLAVGVPSASDVQLFRRRPAAMVERRPRADGPS